MKWDAEKLWKLRMEITLNSLYVASYENSFGIDPRVVCDFFDGYMEFLEDYCKENELGDSLDVIFKEDNEDNLWRWFNCFADGNPLPTKKG